MTDGGTVGSDDEPVDMYATVDPFSDFVPTGGSAYVQTLHLKAASGSYEISAEGGTVVIEHTEADDD